MHSAYNPWLVSLSIGVAIMVSFTSLRLASRVVEAHGSASRAWLVLGSVSMGTGIWAMHFIGMLAFSLPIQLRYSIPLTFVSLAATIVTSGFAIRIASSTTLGLARHCLGSLVMGSGIVVMHYTGMSAIQIFPAISYDPLLVTASVLVAVFASFAALWLTFKLRSGSHPLIWAARLGAAVIMGMAIAGMHYTAMSASQFQQGAFCSGGIALDSTWLAASVALAALALMAITLVTVVFDGHLATRASLHSQWLHKLNSQLIHRQAHDSLTDLPSRGLFIDRLEQAIAECCAAPDSDTLLTVMLIDLDRFSIVNDSLGHGSGDAILLEVTRRLKSLVGSADFVARLGGDEFLVLTRRTQTREVARLAGQIVQALARPYANEAAELHLAASVGITTYPFDDAKPEVLISHADEAMHEMKADGGGGYRFFVPGTTAFSMERLQLENDLRKAPGKGELELHYQPQVDIASGRTIGFEALIRWRHPERGMISPGEFIPLAEESDLIVHIGKWIMEEACRQMRTWHDAGFVTISVAVNLSARQFRQPNLLETIKATVASNGLQPRHIVIELTESAVMSDADRSIAILEELHRSGFQVAVDDFGTGYSSMNYLKRLPVSKLKIDQSFVSELGVSEKTGAIVKAVVQLAHGLDMVVVAEGVETEAQLLCLKALDCDQYQGYLYSRPLTAANATELLRRACAASGDTDKQLLASGSQGAA
jgi:diguanylate cyclase (GGDEF)-like protein